MPGPASVFNGGRIPVLLVIEGQEPLRESAAANAERRRATIDIRATRIPTGAQIDPDFGAVPVGGAKQGRMSLEAVQPAASEKFIIRAFAEPKDGKIPETLDGRAVFSQPRIEPILTCGNSAPLGDFTNVATALNCAVLKANGLTGKNWKKFSAPKK